MLSTSIGRTGVAVTRLGLGAAQLGNLYHAIDDDTARAIVDTAWLAGIRYFDTAPHYGLGLSEQRLGAALAGRPRHEYCLSTKVGRLLVPNPSPTGSDLTGGGFDVPDTLQRRFDFSADGVRRSLEASLDRLGLDRVDVGYVHDPDQHLDDAIAAAVPALVALREQGVIGAVGAAMNTVAPLRRLIAETELDVVMIAGRWTLLDRTAEPMLEQAQARGVAVVAAAPFNSGLLARPRPSQDATFDYTTAPADLLARATALADAADGAGAALPQAAIQFPLRHRAVVSVVVGCAGPDQVRDNAAAFTAHVPDSAWAAIERC